MVILYNNKKKKKLKLNTRITINMWTKKIQVTTVKNIELFVRAITYRTLASVCLRFRRNLWYFCRSPMLPCSACIFAATAAADAAAVAAAAAETTAATWFTDVLLLLAVSELVVLVTLLVRRFFLRFRSAPVPAEAAAPGAVTPGAVTVLGQATPVAGGALDAYVGDWLLVVFRTVSEHELLDSGQSSSANVG